MFHDCINASSTSKVILGRTTCLYSLRQMAKGLSTFWNDGNKILQKTILLNKSNKITFPIFIVTSQQPALWSTWWNKSKTIMTIMSCECINIITESIVDSVYLVLTSGAPSISSMIKQFGLGSCPNTDFICVAAPILVLNISALRSSLKIHQFISMARSKCLPFLLWSAKKTLGSHHDNMLFEPTFFYLLFIHQWVTTT